jgi:hypothetical protein
LGWTACTLSWNPQPRHNSEYQLLPYNTAAAGLLPENNNAYIHRWIQTQFWWGCCAQTLHLEPSNFQLNEPLKTHLKKHKTLPMWWWDESWGVLVDKNTKPKSNMWSISGSNVSDTLVSILKTKGFVHSSSYLLK